ncbi:restriction endonuclease type II-like protein [Leucosporidium creatinivorum]|uniref:DNA excision repair protein ERCC-1 n=1 Tax=Leucosporidium creatinivorum TaxID=106004 RepID=A0A1Y2FZP0_9BASI|nr:restriction endonuclease type II-like protein [Leucosporidium creatinivorum]
MSSSGTPPVASGSGSAPNRPAQPAFSSARAVHASNSSSSQGASANANAGRPGPSGLSAADKGKAPTTGPRAPAPVALNGGRVVQNASNGAGGAAAGAGGAVAGPGGVVRRSTPNTILINVCQKGNPVITNIRSVAWEYGDIKCDYQVGATSGALYLSLRYHLLHPEYIHGRIKNLAHSYALRLMIVHCDVDNHQAAMKELTKVCIVNEYTMIVAWSAQEVARYLEIYKSFERKPPDLIKERVDNSYMAHLTSALTSVRGVNKTDVTTLASNFGTFEKIVSASSDSLSLLPGLGDKKVKRLRDAFEGSFVVGKKKKKSNAQKAGEKGPALN